MPTLADAKLGGARLDEGFLLCHLHRARHHLGRYTVTPRRLSTPTDVTAQQALSTPFGAPSPLWIRGGYCRQLETIHRDANFGAPSQRGFLKVKINDSQSNHLPHH